MAEHGALDVLGGRYPLQMLTTPARPSTAAVADGPGWEGLGDLVAKAAALTNTVVSADGNAARAGDSMAVW